MTVNLDHCDSCGRKFQEGDAYLPMAVGINVHANIDCAWNNFHHEKVSGPLRDITALKWTGSPAELKEKKHSWCIRVMLYIIKRFNK